MYIVDKIKYYCFSTKVINSEVRLSYGDLISRKSGKLCDDIDYNKSIEGFICCIKGGLYNYYNVGENCFVSDNWFRYNVILSGNIIMYNKDSTCIIRDNIVFNYDHCPWSILDNYYDRFIDNLFISYICGFMCIKFVLYTYIVTNEKLINVMETRQLSSNSFVINDMYLLTNNKITYINGSKKIISKDDNVYLYSYDNENGKLYTYYKDGLITCINGVKRLVHKYLDTVIFVCDKYLLFIFDGILSKYYDENLSCRFSFKDDNNRFGNIYYKYSYKDYSIYIMNGFIIDYDYNNVCTKYGNFKMNIL